MHPLPEGLQQLLYIKTFGEAYLKQNCLRYVIEAYISSNTNSYECMSQNEQNCNHYEIPRLEVWVLKMSSDYIEITEEVNICSLEPIFIYLSVRLYSALCLAVGPQEVFSSVCYQISGSCVGPCEEWILSGWPKQDKETVQQTGTDGAVFWYWLAHMSALGLHYVCSYL